MVNGPNLHFQYLQRIKILQNLLILFSKVRRKKYLDYMRRVLNSNSGDLEDLSELALRSPRWRREFFRFNELYSHDIALKRYCGIPLDRSLNVMVEHGLILHRIVVENATLYPGAFCNVVMSQARAEFLKTKDIPAMPIGPYIHYVDPLLSDSQIAEYRRQFGKTLLFFVGHSSKEVSVEKSYQEAFLLIDRLKVEYNFDTVIVCGHFLDIRRKLFKNMPRNSGCLCVSAGFNRFPYFLELLRTYITLADVVASNSVGTQTGYSVFLGKPYWVVGKKNINSYVSGKKRNIEQHLQRMNTPLIGSEDLTLIEFENLLRSYEMGASSCAARKIIGDLWGFDMIRDKSDLNSILLEGADQASRVK